MTKRPSWHNVNYPALKELLEELELPYEEFNKHHLRIMGATHIIDIWPARMVCHRYSGEIIRAKEPYYGGRTDLGNISLDREFNKQQVKKLLETGEL